MTERLTSWTRTLNEEDAERLLDAASPGLSLDAWTDAAHQLLPQPGRDRRTELVRLVREQLLDLADDHIADSAFLRLFHDGSPGRRAALLHGRRLLDNPWIERALADLVYPALAAADEPLAPRDADLVPDPAWDTFVAAHVRPGTGPEATRKTRSEVMRNLARLGVLDVTGNTTREARARHGQPDGVAFSWLLAHELVRSSRAEADLRWAVHHARAPRLYATTAAYAQRCIDEGVAAGLLRRGFLAGQPRLHPGAL